MRNLQIVDTARNLDVGLTGLVTFLSSPSPSPAILRQIDEAPSPDPSLHPWSSL